MIIGLRRIRVLRRHSVASAILWPASRVEIFLNERTAGPLTCGISRSAIILPRDAEAWNDDLNHVLVHELEHVRRRDWLTLCIARAICAAYWFHPLVWIAFRLLTIEAERACDDAVLAPSDAAAYADQLVALARRLAPTRSPLLAIANRSDLATRVHAVLDNHQRRGPAGRLAVAFACAAAALRVFAESPLPVVAPPQPQTTVARRTDLPRFIADSMLVAGPVSVTDNGRPVSGLTA
jgi:beta-lactamase regulating signal transducer with metallopeptidase domain